MYHSNGSLSILLGTFIESNSEDNEGHLPLARKKGVCLVRESACPTPQPSLGQLFHLGYLPFVRTDGFSFEREHSPGWVGAFETGLGRLNALCALET